MQQDPSIRKATAIVNGTTPLANCGSSTSTACPGTRSKERCHPNVLTVTVLGFAPGCIRKVTGAVWPGGVATVICDASPPFVQKPCGSG